MKNIHGNIIWDIAVNMQLRDRTFEASERQKQKIDTLQIIRKEITLSKFEKTVHSFYIHFKQ